MKSDTFGIRDWRGYRTLFRGDSEVCLETGGVGGTHPAKGTQVSLGDQQPLGVAALGQNVDEQVLVTAWKRVVLERQ